MRIHLESICYKNKTFSKVLSRGVNTLKINAKRYLENISRGKSKLVECFFFSLVYAINDINETQCTLLVFSFVFRVVLHNRII